MKMRLLTGLTCTMLMGSRFEAEAAGDPNPVCKPEAAPPAAQTREQVYQSVPYQAGEEARYTLKYGLLKVHVGYGFLRVQAPIRHEITTGDLKGEVQKQSLWHRVFEAEAYTGDWFKLIFVAHDMIRVLSRPWDQAVSHFYLDQDEEKPFVRRFKTEQWISFDHISCKAYERTVNHKKKTEKKEEFFLEPGASEALSAFFRLRTLSFASDKPETFTLYTSEKNWTLEAKPLKKETLETTLGKFETQKIQLRTYLGGELQKKGDLFVWIASDRPARPIVKIEADLGFSSVFLEIDQYKEGKAL